MVRPAAASFKALLQKAQAGAACARREKAPSACARYGASIQAEHTGAQGGCKVCQKITQPCVGRKGKTRQKKDGKKQSSPHGQLKPLQFPSFLHVQRCEKQQNQAGAQNGKPIGGHAGIKAGGIAVPARVHKKYGGPAPRQHTGVMPPGRCFLHGRIRRCGRRGQLGNIHLKQRRQPGQVGGCGLAFSGLPLGHSLPADAKFFCHIFLR